jgi:hypothetical protein
MTADKFSDEILTPLMTVNNNNNNNNVMTAATIFRWNFNWFDDRSLIIYKVTKMTADKFSDEILTPLMTVT